MLIARYRANPAISHAESTTHRKHFAPVQRKTAVVCHEVNTLLMRSRNLLPILLAAFSWIFLAACTRDEEANSFSCSELHLAIVENDLPAVKRVLEPIMASLRVPANADNGTDQLRSVVEFVNDCQTLDARLLCFECVQTLPAQSEIELTVHAGIADVTKIIDIQRDRNQVLRVVNMHD